jgi:tetratricopeptide (TPR) repeat protein
MRRAVGLALVLSLPFTSLFTAEGHSANHSWREVHTDHFTIVSSAGDHDTRQLAWQLEQVRSAIAAVCPWAQHDPPKPLLVLAAGDENDMRALAPAFWEKKSDVRPDGIMVTGADRYYIAIRADLREDTTSHLRALRSWNPMPLGRLLSVPGRSPDFANAERLADFDAESWAFMHLLLFGDNGIYLPKINAFVALLQKGTAFDQSSEEAFGPVERYNSRLIGYLAQSVFQYSRFPVDVRIKREAFPQRTLSVAEATADAAAFHLAMGRTAEAGAAIEKALQADASQPDAYVAQGMLLDTQGKGQDARRSIFLRARQYDDARAEAQLAAGLARTDLERGETGRVLSEIDQARSAAQAPTHVP